MNTIKNNINHPEGQLSLVLAHRNIQLRLLFCLVQLPRHQHEQRPGIRGTSSTEKSS